MCRIRTIFDVTDAEYILNNPNVMRPAPDQQKIITTQTISANTKKSGSAGAYILPFSVLSGFFSSILVVFDLLQHLLNF